MVGRSIVIVCSQNIQKHSSTNETTSSLDEGVIDVESERVHSI